MLVLFLLQSVLLIFQVRYSHNIHTPFHNAGQLPSTKAHKHKKYGELSDFSENISTILPSRSLLFLLTENNVGGIAWSIGCINSGNVPLILNAHIEKELLHNLPEI